ncbi:MAG: acetyl-CoA C-acetyltransferase [Deltaproteobacteria bacterium]|nr:acetyl-CoA C-acetyltransferase [Candidatus Anaeroferrophillus wilburensis]
MKNGRDVVIVAMGRSAIGVFGGSLKDVRAHQLGAQVIKGVLEKVPAVNPAELDDVIMGDCVQSPDEANTARTAALAAGIPVEVPAVTIQRQCSSAMEALTQAANQIRLGDAELVLAGGMESMSNAFYCLPAARWGARLQHGTMMDSMWELLHSGSSLLDPPGFIMGQTAENLALHYGISRQEQDAIALRSHNNAEKAIEQGNFKEEIVPIVIPRRKGDPQIFDSDEHVRRSLTMADLERLKPIYATTGTVTAGNASGLNDGAAICLLASRQKALALGLPILARIWSSAVAGCDPKMMGWGPVPATRKLFQKTGCKLSDIELVELNEAFAAQYLACEQGLDLNRDITNVNGSGIGLGHPVGCTGARIVISLLQEMKRRNLSLGLATLCVGGGMGMSMLVENE